MDQVHVIRHKYYNEQVGIRKIAREMGLDRKTVRKYLKDAEPMRRDEGKGSTGAGACWAPYRRAA